MCTVSGRTLDRRDDSGPEDRAPRRAGDRGAPPHEGVQDRRYACSRYGPTATRDAQPQGYARPGNGVSGMRPIRFGTEGWRAVLADDYTFDNVRIVARAAAQWFKGQPKRAPVAIGHDTRFMGERFVAALDDEL